MNDQRAGYTSNRKHKRQHRSTREDARIRTTSGVESICLLLLAHGLTEHQGIFFCGLPGSVSPLARDMAAVAVSATTFLDPLRRTDSGRSACTCTHTRQISHIVNAHRQTHTFAQYCTSICSLSLFPELFPKKIRNKIKI